MTLNIPLTTESLVTLRARAAAEGKDIESFVRDAIEEKLASGNGEALQCTTISAEEWCARLDAWIASFPRVPHRVDDSRESIYAERGE